MPEPTTVTLIVKAAATAVTDKRVRKVIGTIILAVLSPFILLIAVIVGIFSGISSHNDSAVSYVFNGGAISPEVPSEYRQYIDEICVCFNNLDTAITEKNKDLDENIIDSDRVKAVFYALHFGNEALNFDDDYYKDFVNCFIGSRINDDDSDEMIFFYLENSGEVYENISDLIGREITTEEKNNANKIYIKIKIFE